MYANFNAHNGWWSESQGFPSSELVNNGYWFHQPYYQQPLYHSDGRNQLVHIFYRAQVIKNIVEQWKSTLSFSGRPDEVARTFLHEFLHKCKFHGIVNDERLNVIPILLIDQAKIWFDKFAGDNYFVSFKDFQEKFIGFFESNERQVTSHECQLKSSCHSSKLKSRNGKSSPGEVLSTSDDQVVSNKTNYLTNHTNTSNTVESNANLLDPRVKNVLHEPSSKLVKSSVNSTLDSFDRKKSGNDLLIQQLIQVDVQSDRGVAKEVHLRESVRCGLTAGCPEERMNMELPRKTSTFEEESSKEKRQINFQMISELELTREGCETHQVKTPQECQDSTESNPGITDISTANHQEVINSQEEQLQGVDTEDDEDQQQQQQPMMLETGPAHLQNLVEHHLHMDCLSAGHAGEVDSSEMNEWVVQPTDNGLRDKVAGELSHAPTNKINLNEEIQLIKYRSMDQQHPSTRTKLVQANEMDHRVYMVPMQKVLIHHQDHEDSHRVNDDQGMRINVTGYVEGYRQIAYWGWKTRKKSTVEVNFYLCELRGSTITRPEFACLKEGRCDKVNLSHLLFIICFLKILNLGNFRA